MRYDQATIQQLLTIVYHEPVERIEKQKAMQEIKRRERQAYQRPAQHRIVRGTGA